MQSLQLKSDYFSLSAFDWDEIPKLAIITGLNGIGKTQFLRLMGASSGAMDLEGLFRYAASPLKIKPPPTSVGYLPALWEITNAKIGHEFFAPINELMQMLDSPADEPTTLGEMWSALVHRIETAANAAKPTTARLINVLKNSVERSPPASRTEVLARLRTYDLVTRDFNQPLTTLVQIFYSYVNARVTALLRGEPENEIDTRLGIAPWDQANQLLQDFEVSFRVTSPDDLRFTYALECHFPASGDIISPDELSSGEQAVLALVALVVTTSVLGTERPTGDRDVDLLLLDEPDSHLHTSGVKSYLDHIQQLTERGVQIIMVTHRPDTIALAPDGSLFEMRREGGRTSLVKVSSKAELIGRLAADTVAVLPGVRVVLVEDEDDRRFHQWAYDRARELGHLPQNPRLVFMPVIARDLERKAGGGKHAVITRLAEFRREGLGAVYRGLIDGDNETEPPPVGVVRLERYTLESYFADPVALYCAVVSGKSIDEDLEFSSGGGVHLGNLGSLRTASPDKLQRIADLVLGRIEQATSLADHTRRPVTLYGDLGAMQLEYPQWLFSLTKKDLRAAIGRLSKAVLSREHLNNGPERAGLVPEDLVSAYRRLVTDRS